MSDQKSDPYVQYLHAEWNLHRSNAHRADAVRNTVAESRVRRVLDAGAGAGQEMQPVIGDGDALGVGLDIAPSAGPTGRHLYKSEFPDNKFFKIDAVAKSWDDASAKYFGDGALFDSFYKPKK